MMILNACDVPYLKHSIPLINSIARNTNEGMIFTLIPDQGKGPEWQKDICANFRVLMMFQAIHTDAEGPVLWLDSDSIVRMPLDPLDKMLREEADVISVYTPEMSAGGLIEENAWLISTVGIARTPAGREFAAVWLGILMQIVNAEGYSPSIMTCQIAFVRAVKKMEKVCRIKDIGYDWSDKNFGELSPIWEAQGPTRKEDPKWKAEQDKYR